MRNVIRLVTVFVVLSLVAAAASATGTTEASSDDGALTITALTNYDPQNTEDAETQAYLLQKQAYLDANPDIVIDEEVLSYSDMVTKIRTLAAADQLPNYFKLGGDVVRPFAEGNAISPIDYIFDANPGYREMFQDGSLVNFSHEGRTYGVPVRISAHLVFYNSEMLSQAGFDTFPETWSEFAELSDALNETFGDNPNFRPIGLGARARWIINNYFSFMTLQNAGIEWYQSLQAGSGAAWTDEPVLEAARQFRALVENESFNQDFASIDQNQQRALFYAGNAAMFFSGNWSTGYVYNSAPQELLDVAQVASYPEFADGAIRNVVAGGAGWSIGINHNDDQDVKDALGDLIPGIFGKDWAIAEAELGAIPPIKLADDEYDTSGLTPMARQTNRLVGSLGLLPVLDHRLPAAMMDTISSEIQLLLIGETTPEQFTQNLQAAWEEIQAAE